MAGARRPRARIAGTDRAADLARKAGAAVRASRTRRRIKQTTLAALVGISQGRLADIEGGRGAGAPLEVWLALAAALDRYLKFEFARDPQADLADAGHLDMQELMLRVSRPGGWQGGFELNTKPADPARSIDVPLRDRANRRLAVVECWNTFGDLGYATRTSDRKVAEARQLAVVSGGEGPEFQVGLCWVVRDTKANRALVGRYPQIFEARFPGSSAAWVAAITGGAAMPEEPGLVWCDLRATRLFARRRTSRSPLRGPLESSGDLRATRLFARRRASRGPR